MKNIEMNGLEFLKDYRSAMGFMFSRSGPIALLLGLLLFSVYRLFLSDPLLIDFVIMAVFIGCRSFVEWGLHMYIFNAAKLPLVGWRLRNPISAMHMEHHKNPSCPEGLFFGWAGVLMVVLLSFSILTLVFGDVRLAASGVIAVIINLLLYEWFHLISHSSISPTSRFFRRAVDNHRRHHSEDGRLSLGVSSILADKLLGTYVE